MRGRKGCNLKLALRCRHSLEGGGSFGAGTPVAPKGRSGLQEGVSRLPDRDMYGGVPAKANFQSSLGDSEGSTRGRGHRNKLRCQPGTVSSFELFPLPVQLRKRPCGGQSRMGDQISDPPTPPAVSVPARAALAALMLKLKLQCLVHLM